jgi:hypothetical protein
MKRYFKYRWNETRGDEFDDWGFSTWYSEFDEDFYASRQLEIFDNGNILKYNGEHFSDEFGMLGDKSLSFEELKDSGSVEISQDEFANTWASHKDLNE